MASRRFRAPSPLRARRRGARAEPRAQLLPRRRPHLLHPRRRSNARSRASSICSFRSTARFGSRRSASSLRRAPRSAWAPTRNGTPPRAALAEALKQNGLSFEVSPGEGAFYGPKLEFHVRDAIKRSWQLGTIQVDYALPDRFELEYIGDDGKAHRPVMLHRAILGSLERFSGVYIEHVAGAFPVWLAPEQVALVTVSEKHLDYALEVTSHFARPRSPRGERLGGRQAWR